VKLIIEDDEGRRTVLPLLRGEVLIGRAPESTVRLPEKNVSRRHARLVRDGGRFYLEDLGSFTGTRLNGEKLRGRRQIAEGDLVQIGEYDLTIESGPGEKALPPPPAPPPARPWVGPVVVLAIVLAAAALTVVWMSWHRPLPGAALPWLRYTAAGRLG
jgi:hypothetical protein